MTRARPLAGRPRPGFTLLELLVVLAIITLLAALTSAAVLKFIGLQQRNNTVTALKMMKQKSDTQWQSVSEKAFNDKSQLADQYIAAWLAQNPGGSTQAARAAYVQAMLVQAFPVTFNDIVQPDPLGVIPPWAAYQTFLSSRHITGSTAATQPIEASVCLLLTLTVGPQNTGATAETFGSAYVLTEPLGTGMAFQAIDGWGTPLGVTRSANGLVITSAGPDRMLGTADDISTSTLPW